MIGKLLLADLRDVYTIESYVTLKYKEWRKLFVTAVWTEKSTSFSEADINLPLMYSL